MAKLQYIMGRKTPTKLHSVVYTCPWWSIHDRVGDGRCEQSHHHLAHAFNITGKEDWIYPSSDAVMAGQQEAP